MLGAIKVFQNAILRCVGGLLCSSFLIFTTVTARAVTLDWTRQFGTTVDDQAYGISADGLGNIYVSGDTYGDLHGTTGNVAYVSKYDALGSHQWTRRPAASYGHGVSADDSGNVFVAGWNWVGNQIDAYVTKYDATGNSQWLKQLSSSTRTISGPVSTDGLGNVYIAGSTKGSLAGPNAGDYDSFLAKYNATGDIQWIKQFGTSQLDHGRGVSADGLGNVYVSGATTGNFDGPNAGGWDAFVTKYDAAGNFLWKRQFGTTGSEHDGDTFSESKTVAADVLGNVYVAGQTTGNLGGPNDGFWDAFVVKYDAAGVLQWTRQLGTESDDVIKSVSADGLGNVYIAGDTRGDLDGNSAGHNSDAFVAKYDSFGNLEWTRQIGAEAFDFTGAVAADGLGRIYLTGTTRGDLAELNAGGDDLFVVKYSEASVPIAGDYNGNGTVDAADYTVWRDTLGSTTNLAADGNGGGVVDAGDYGVWKANFGATEAGEASAAVPEPSTLVLAALSILCTWCRYRSR
jgi:hypothetical protein